jgi:hypothetical protein
VLPDLPLEGWWLQPGNALNLSVEVTPQHIGIICSLLVFEFQSTFEAAF